MSESAQRQGSTDKLTPREFREFRRLFYDWLDENQDRLEERGTGDVKSLAERSLEWAKRQIAKRQHIALESGGALQIDHEAA